MTATKIHLFLIRILAACLLVCAAMASEYHGTVKTGGLPVPGATVTAIQGDKKVVTTTDERGAFSFAELADGKWTLEVEMLGFAKLNARSRRGARCAGSRSGIEDPLRGRAAGCAGTIRAGTRSCACDERRSCGAENADSLPRGRVRRRQAAASSA